MVSYIPVKLLIFKDKELEIQEKEKCSINLFKRRKNSTHLGLSIATLDDSGAVSLKSLREALWPENVMPSQNLSQSECNRHFLI